MLRRLTALTGSVLLAAACLTVSSAPALAGSARGADESTRPGSTSTGSVSVVASLSHCQIPDPYPPGYLTRVCTQITGAPASGVQVLDNTSNRITTLYNGDTVYLNHWSRDRTGLCGVNGDSYVWNIGWISTSGGFRSAFIGDYYLATGSVDTWYWFRVDPRYDQVLGDYDQGWGGGTCDVYPHG